MSNTIGNTGAVVNDLHSAEARWFAVYTKYKCEKYVVRQLQKKGIEAYVPLITRVKQYVRKTKRYELPLINCYIFVKIVKADYVKVLETEYVMTFIKQRKHLISIPEEEITLLRRVVGEIKEVESNPKAFTSGSAVEIISGNLTGIKGTLVEEHGKRDFVVELESIGYQLRMTIDKSLLRPLSRPLGA